jgi:hypothetical protein
MAAPWRIVLLDRSDPEDPKWCICSVLIVGAVEHDHPGADHAAWRQDALKEVRSQAGSGRVQLAPLTDVLAWRLDEPRPGITESS